ncbi:hypothetical protein B7P43_G02695 [Cryptotermes secundus]|uniref:Uncharacterized protein n=1 Tax=Cryptotermes secundus TaxID=105785 RepID=A0A2J7QDR6_9NEOP|nr:hypothetical protein B7P43_G02695 [Cryptotermes secundus]
MSTVLLTAHDENIYNIIKKEDAKPSPKIRRTTLSALTASSEDPHTHTGCKEAAR